MITNYLIDLLKDNECVIVPKFGAFISKRVSASIDYANHRFEPPYKEIVFNDKLRNNDEVLVNYVSEKESVSKETSLDMIMDFVHQTEAVLDVNSEIELKGFGKLRKFGEDYVFEADKNINMLGDAFGLSAFNIQPVFRTETYQVIKEQIYVEQKAKNTEYTIAIESVEDKPETITTRKPNLFRTFTYTLLAFFLVFVANWTTDREDSNLASWNPFLYSSPNEFLLNVMEQDFEESENFKTLESENLSNSATQQLSNSGTQGLSNSATQQLSNSATQQLSNSATHYYIIGGSFKTSESAGKCVEGLKRQGFENASSLEMNDKGNIRVYYESYAEKTEALVRLEAIKKEYNESAWLLFQK
ncbi:MAG: hypothetical protein IJZ06_01145 [Bacteroidales bacterium]|nr:hypothetical protein [Bacteroidales bacterium]